MIFSKRRHEGYLLKDHRAAGIGMPGEPLFVEAPIVTCSHCQRQVVMNPLRTRDRAYCPKCDHYICDQCEGIRQLSGGECKTFKQVMDEVCEAAEKGRPVGSIIKPGDPLWRNA